MTVLTGKVFAILHRLDSKSQKEADRQLQAVRFIVERLYKLK